MPEREGRTVVRRAHAPWHTSTGRGLLEPFGLGGIGDLLRVAACDGDGVTRPHGSATLNLTPGVGILNRAGAHERSQRPARVPSSRLVTSSLPIAADRWAPPSPAPRCGRRTIRSGSPPTPRRARREAARRT